MMRWLLNWLDNGHDPQWKPTGYTVTAAGRYDYDKAVAGKRRAESRATAKRKAEARVPARKVATVTPMRRRA